ncbi:MAG: lysostaphin resistance A-like protein [Candidatus Thorarchaeota archaeon]
MIEWIIAVGLGVFFIIVMYNVSFVIMMKSRKRISYLQGMKTEPWRTNVIIAPVVLVFSLLIVAIYSGGNWVDWGFVLPDGFVMVTSILVGAIGGLLVTLIQSIAHRRQEPSEISFSITKTNVRGYILLIIIVASIAEEVVFRGLFQQMIDKSLYLVIDLGGILISSGCIASAVLFGLVHIMAARQMEQSVTVMVFGAIALGLVAGTMFLLSASILVPIIIHMEFNILSPLVEKLVEKR